MYVYEAETTIMADAIPTERDYLTYYMIEGCSNWRAMTEYLKDPRNSPGVKGDDFGVLRDNIGKTVHLYGMRSYSDKEYLWFGNYSFPCTRVLDPYNIPAIEADEGDVVRIDIESATSNEGMERDGAYLYRHGTDSGYVSVHRQGVQVRLVGRRLVLHPPHLVRRSALLGPGIRCRGEKPQRLGNGVRCRVHNHLRPDHHHDDRRDLEAQVGQVIPTGPGSSRSPFTLTCSSCGRSPERRTSL